MKQKTQSKKLQKPNNNFNIEDFTFLRDLLLVKAIRPESDNGLVDPQQYEDKNEFGIVVRVGKEVKDIEFGDTIRFGKYSTENIRTNGEDFYIVHEEDCSAVLR